MKRPAAKKRTPVTAGAERLHRGMARPGVSFPVPPSSSGLPGGYDEVLQEIKQRIAGTRTRVVVAANAAMTLLYWEIGCLILQRQGAGGWGAKVIDRLSADLQQAHPDMSGFSPRNLKYMRTFAAAWPDRQIVQRVIAQLPWRQNIALLDKLKSASERLWYAQQSVAHGWSQPVLVHQIEAQLHLRQGRAINNFTLTLPPEDSDTAGQIFKDPYLFDFLGTADLRKEREVEQALVDHVQRFLLELGAGFAFVGRQVHLEFSSRDYYLDLLFYHLKLRRYVVVELKAVPFDPSFVGTMNMYLTAVDELLRHPDDQPAIGMLLCRSRDKLVAEYALRGFAKPMGVAEWETKLVHKLPRELQTSLPTVKEIEAELTRQTKPRAKL